MMRSKIQEKGWAQMHTLLDAEMPVQKRRRSFLVPFIIAMISVLSGIYFYAKNYPTTSPQVPNTTPVQLAEKQQNIAATSSHLEDIERIRVGKNSEIQRTISLNNSNHSENNFAKSNLSDIDFESKLSEYGSISKINNLSQIDQTPINPSIQIIEVDNLSEPIVNSLEADGLLKVNIEQLPSLSNGVVSDGSIGELYLISVDEIDMKRDMEFDMAIGFGQNVTNKNAQMLWAQIGYRKQMSQKWQFVSSLGISSQKTNLYSFASQENLFDPSNPTGTELNANYFNNVFSRSNYFVDASIGVNLLLSRKLKFGVGVNASYSIYDIEDDQELRNEFSDSKNYDNFLTNFKSTFNPLHISPYVNLEYSLHKRWSILGTYSHDLNGVSKSVSFSSQQFYFREVKLGLRYRF